MLVRQERGESDSEIQELFAYVSIKWVWGFSEGVFLFLFLVSGSVGVISSVF